MADADRPLTPEGIAEVQQAAEALASAGLRPKKVLTSPLLRALETATILAEGVGAALERCPALAPASGLDEMLEALRSAVGEGGIVAAVGHLPDVADLTRRLAGAEARVCGGFLPGSMARLDFALEVSAGAGRLRWLYPPRELCLVVRRGEAL
jgi:phosphohistidine phosphatase